MLACLLACLLQTWSRAGARSYRGCIVHPHPSSLPSRSSSLGDLQSLKNSDRKKFFDATMFGFDLPARGTAGRTERCRAEPMLVPAEGMSCTLARVLPPRVLSRTRPYDSFSPEFAPLSRLLSWTRILSRSYTSRRFVQVCKHKQRIFFSN